mgnify:FL=1|tara:strand:- start:13016 stop:13570 length:555 start_codon:yes stop_codon:yes gene_type:complete
MKTPLNTINDLLLSIDKIDRSRDKSLISLIAATGLYIDEVRHLSPEDINDDLSKLQTSGKRPRQLTISPFAKEHLHQWLLERPKSKHKALFISLTGNKSPLSQRGIDNILRKWSDSINLNFNYQKLRTLSHTTFHPDSLSKQEDPPISSSALEDSRHSISITRTLPILSLCLVLLYKVYKSLSK